MPPSRRVLTAISVAVLIGFGASAASASAATVTINKGCVIFEGDYRAPATTITGRGFSPYSSVSLSTVSKKKPTPAYLGVGYTNGSGDFVTFTGAAPFNSVNTRDQKFTLIAVDSKIPTLAAIVPFRQVKAGYTRVPDPRRPGQMVRHIAQGFVPGKRVYAHFRHGGKTRVTRSLGKAKTACGIARKRMRALPAKSRLGMWKVYVDQKKKFKLSTRPQARLTFTVFQKFS
jgi:hypothetical protein